MIHEKLNRRELGQLTAGVMLARFNPDPTPAPVVCPIYTFHEVMSSSSFADFVIEKLKTGMTPISISQLLDYFDTDIKTWSTDPFALSLDDALKSQVRNALPFLKDYQIPATFNVMPGWRGDGVHEYMTPEDYKHITRAGLKTGSHTIDHADLPQLRVNDLGSWEAEIIQSKSILEDIIEAPVEVFCYPNGDFDPPTLEVVSRNYRGALSTRPGTVHLSTDRYILKRVHVT